MSYQTIEQRIVAASQFTGGNGGSTATITVVAGSSLVHLETFKLRARRDFTEFTFVFDKSGKNEVAETEFTRRVVVADGMTTTQVRNAIIEAVNRTPGLGLYASINAAAVLNLLNSVGGTAGNLPALPDTVVNAGFIVTALTGGVNRAADPFILDGVKVFPAAETFGGSFEFDFNLKRLIENAPAGRPQWRVERILMDVTTAVSYTLSVLLPDGRSHIVQTGAGGTVLISTPIILAGDERLILVTAGASGAMWARVTARPCV